MLVVEEDWGAWYMKIVHGWKRLVKVGGYVTA